MVRMHRSVARRRVLDLERKGSPCDNGPVAVLAEGSSGERLWEAVTCGPGGGFWVEDKGRL